MFSNNKNSRKNLVGRTLSTGLMGMLIFCGLLTSAAHAGTEGCCGVDIGSSAKATSATKIPSSSKSRRLFLLAQAPSVAPAAQVADAKRMASVAAQIKANPKQAKQILTTKQISWCGTSTARPLGLRAVGCGSGAPDLPANRDANIPTPSTDIKYIRIKFNILAKDDGSSPVATTADVNAQMAQLNADFAPARIQFINNGINIRKSTRYRNPTSRDDVAVIKNLFNDNPVSNLNFYVFDAAGFNTLLLGAGYFPWDYDPTGTFGGFFCDDNAFGAGGRTATHEVGHCLGLWHTFHGVEEVGSCSSPCREKAGRSVADGDTTGDFCSDTPPTPRSFSCGSPGGTNSCNSVAWGTTDFSNFMGYAGDSCINHFTPQQMGLMHGWLKDKLSSWYSPVIQIDKSLTGEEGSPATFGGSIFALNVTRENDTSGTATVHYKTVDGTAKGGSDFTAIPDTVLTFAPGETSKSINVFITGDDGLEPDETFTIVLSNVQGAVLGNTTATVTIKNDDIGLIVTTLADSENANDNDNSLREAITAANAKSGSDIITFVAGLTGNINLTKALPDLSSDLVITGLNASVTVRRNTGGNYRIFNVTAGGSVTLNRIGVDNGLVSGANGGGIANAGTLYVNLVAITGCSSDNGGGISNTGTLTVTNCSIYSNRGQNFGGGLNNSGTLTINNSTLDGNRGDFGGGGIFNSGVVTVNNSTIRGNRTALSSGPTGGGISSEGTATLTVTNSTITANLSFDQGGGVYSPSTASTTLRNSIVALNTLFEGTNGPDISGAVASASNYNLIGDVTGMTGITNGTNGNKIGTGAAPIDPKLGPLADNEGPTQTMALLPGSPAVNAGDPAVTGAGLTDQRGTGFPRVQQTRLDMGAFEFYDGPQSLSFKVTTLDDRNDGVCGELDCTLAEAIVAANLRDASQTAITFKSGLTGTINLTGPLPEVTANMDIIGPGAGLLTVRRNTGGNYPVFVVNATGNHTLSLFNLTISNGLASGGSGGGVKIVSGQLYIEGCTLSGNSATNGGAIGPNSWEVYKCVFTGNTATNSGGALYNDGSGLLVRLTNSTVSDNTADNVGGGVANSGGTLYIFNCEISGNTGAFGGGGLYNNGTAIVSNSTLDGNQTTPNFGGAGGGIGNDVVGTITVQSATVTGNSADDGGGIWNHATGTLTLENSIVALNTAVTSGPDFNGAAQATSKFSLVGNGTGMTGISNSTNGNKIGTGTVPIDPKIGSLADNGGTTKTRALLTGSPAINSGDPNFNKVQRDDQRGDGRIPSLFPRVMGGRIDMGAFEFYFLPIPPEVSIDDLTLTEGDSGTKTANFTVTLSEASEQKVTVQYKTEDGTATAVSDYTAVPLTELTFNPGQTQKTISVTFKGDTVAEVNETFFVDLSAGVNGNIVKSRGICNLTDEEGLSFFTVNDVTLTEGNSGTKIAAFTVTLAPASTKTITVQYATADGIIYSETGVEPGAQSGSDYVAVPLTTLTFTPGQTSKTVNVTISGDTQFESDEPFLVGLSTPTNAEISDPIGLATITNDDAAALPTLSINDVNVLEGNSVNFTVTLSAVSAQAVTVNYSTVNGNATAPGDYTAKTGTLTIPAGQTIGIINIVTTGDTLDEVDETFFVNLSAPTNATIADTQGRGSIIDNDSAPAVTINDVTVTEGDTGTKNATFTITLNAASGQTVTINAIPSNGTARTPADYTTGGARLIFAPGETVKTFSVPVKGDLLDEPDETFFVILSQAVNCSVGRARATGTIVDNDAGPTISIDDVRIGEGNAGQRTAAFRLRLSAPSGQVVRVSYATAGGSAAAGVDYVAVPVTQIAFTAGNIYAYARVLINGDVLNEPDETFNVNLTAPINATIADTTALGTILNDDSAPSLTINDVSISEGNPGTKNLTFTVTLSKVSGQAVTVNYATADGGARSTSDYTAKTGTLTFAAGQTSKTISVVISGDTLVESNETFFVLLSASTNASIGKARGTGTINNDDSSG